MSIFTGRYPPSTAIHLNGETQVAAGFTTAAEILSDQGFFTAAAVGGYPLAAKFPTRRGFHVYDDRMRVGPTGEALERPAREVVGAAVQALSSRGSRRVFLWVHLFDAHDPYEPPSPFHGRYPADPYQGEIASMDAALTEQSSAVEQVLGTDQTFWAVVADHGESLGEHGEDTHGYFLYESTLRVPFLLAGPGVEAGKVLTTPVPTVDLLPTALARLGIAALPGMAGTDVLAAQDGASRRLYAETRLPAAYYGFAPLRGAIEGSLKYIDAPRPELYELQRDPQETRNVLAERSEDANLLSRWLDTFGAGGSAPSPVDPRLSSLGYLGLAPSPGGGRRDPKDGLPLYRDFQAASRALERGEPERALPLLDRLLADSDSPSLRLKRAQALRMSGRLRDAASELGRARGGSGELPGVHLEGARIAAALGDWPAALREANAHLVADPGSPAALLFRGAALESSGQTARAEADYRGALGVDPTYGDASLRLAALMVRSGRLADAREVLREHLRLHPADPMAAGLLNSL
jgi:tetratricopeptide (TPR) repeat protein